jgi:Icc-related predicted phosphoesterase
MTKIVCIADVHNFRPELPKGDILVVGGDLTDMGTMDQTFMALDWIAEQPHEVKIITPGNHDFFFQTNTATSRKQCEELGIVLLMDEEYHTHGLHFWGAPWQPWFHNWAFNLERGPDIAEKWDLIPMDTDVLITHGPALGHLDDNPMGWAVGCEDLMRTVGQVKPRLHVFGHIHHSYGVQHTRDTLFVNASLCTEAYQPINPPVVVHL